MSDWLVRTPDLTFRRVGNDDDEIVFQSLKDWPPDQHGPWTRKRAIERVGMANREQLYSHSPIVKRCDELAHCKCTNCSDFFENIIIEVTGVGGVGYTQARIWKDRVWVQFISLLEGERGKGRFEEIYWLYTWLIFEVWKAGRLMHSDFMDVGALARMRDAHGGHYFENERTGRDRWVTDRQTTKWMYTKEMYDQLADDEAYLVNGAKLVIEQNDEFFAQQNRDRRSL